VISLARAVVPWPPQVHHNEMPYFMKVGNMVLKDFHNSRGGKCGQFCSSICIRRGAAELTVGAARAV